MKRLHENLDLRLHRKLRALPEPVAPGDLMARVRERIAAQEGRPWWRRPWLEWPRVSQIFSAGMLAVLVTTLAVWREGLLALLRGWVRQIPGAAEFFHQSGMVAQTFEHIFTQLTAGSRFPWMTAAAVVLLTIYLGIIGVGAFFYQMVVKERGGVK